MYYLSYLSNMYYLLYLSNMYYLSYLSNMYQGLKPGSQSYDSATLATVTQNQHHVFAG